MLPVGNHDLEFVADALGFRARRTMTITAGQTTNATMSLPQAAVNLNAVPWADVTVDGKDIGQTPIANLMLTIGTHQVDVPTSAVRRQTDDRHRLAEGGRASRGGYEGTMKTNRLPQTVGVCCLVAIVLASDQHHRRAR